MHKKRTGNGLVSTMIAVILGNALYALSVKLFLLPSGLITGGTTGIAISVHHYFGIPISLFVFGFNVMMLVVGYLVLGKTFASTTLASTFLYPFLLELLDRWLGNMVITNDILLCTLFSGLGIGMALGIVIRSGASTGGMDIPPLVLKKFFKLPVSFSMYVFDVIILLSQALFSQSEMILYGIVLIIIYTMTLDKMLLLGTTRTEIKVISHRANEIRDAILKQMDRGVTMLDGEGGYQREKLQMIFSVISNRELPKIERIVHEIDPECFMSVSRVSEVRGRGFTMNKKYQ